MSTDADRPNILILHADQHRWDCLGCYGTPDIRTPALDALAEDSVLYENHFCSLPVCTPSRYSLITGLYVHQHQGWTNHSTIRPALPTFPRRLRDAGYRTAAVGKMHYTPTYLDVGFERMLLAEQHGPGRHDDDYHRYLRDLGLADRADLTDQVREYRGQAPPEYWECFGAMPSDLPEEHHSTTWIADRALEALDPWTGGGNLLMVGFIKPHHPFDPPASWADLYDPPSLSLRPGWTEQPIEDVRRMFFDYTRLTEPVLRRVMAHYYATISQIDHHVGRILALLKARGLYDNTLVLYTSDHGEYLGFHHMLLKGGPMYDPLVRTPLLVKYPRQVRAGERNAGLVSHVDVAPTLLGAVQLDVPETWPGVDLAAETAGYNYVFAEDRRGASYMARSQTGKLLWNRGGPCRFFDLAADPLEQQDLYDDPARQPEIAAHKQALAEWALLETPTPPYVDEGAPRCRAPNVPALQDDHRQRSVRYFRQKMAD